MAIIVSGKEAKVHWLTNHHSKGTLTKNQGILYITKDGKLGKATAESYAGLTPAQAFERRYGGMKSAMNNDFIADDFIVFDKDTAKHADPDDGARAFILNLAKKKLIPFSANVGSTQKENTNSEALISYTRDQHLDILISTIKQYFGLSPKIDYRDMWIPRDGGTAYGQDVMVEELATKMLQYNHCGLNGHTGLAKTMIVSAALQSKIFPNGGAFILFTSPISDTLDDVETNFSGFYYPDSDRDREVIVYREKDIGNMSIIDIANQAHKEGKFVVLALTVQDLRYQDDPNLSAVELREKYQDLLNVNIDYYVRDEVQTNYGGPITSLVLNEVARKTRLVDTSASLNKLADLYPSGAIVNRGLFWALEYEKDRGTPHVHIETLAGLDFADLDPKVKDVYDQEDGWTPSKLTEMLPNGQLKSLIAIDYILEQQYINIDEKEFNALSIINDTDIPYKSRQVGLHVFPEGTNGISAGKYLTKLADDLNSMTKWNKNKAIFITPYDYTKHGKPKQSYKDIIDNLLQKFEHVIIMTHRMWTVGSNIPQLGHVVEWDCIRDPYNQEQLYPGRTFRIADWKTDVKVYVITPNASLEDSICHLAKITSKLSPLDPDPKEKLKNISFKHYQKNLGIVEHTVEEVYGKYNNNLLSKVKPAPALNDIELCLGLTDLAALSSADIDENSELNKGGTTELTEDNGAKQFKWQDTDDNGNEKGKPKTLSLKQFAKKINAIMLEIPAFAVLNKKFIIEDALNYWAVRKMFGSTNVDLILAIINQNRQLKSVVQNWLTDIHQAYQSLPFEELHDYIFKNTQKKKEIGLVFIDMVSADTFVKNMIKHQGIPKNYKGSIAVVNALSASICYCLNKKFPKSKIVCIEDHTYYVDHLRSNGYEVYCLDDLNENGNMRQKCKFWYLNPPYQKDAGGTNDDDNKQGSYWYKFLDKALITKQSTKDAKYFVVSPKSVFGAGGFGSKTHKVTKILEHAQFKHIFPDVSHHFPGIGIPITGYVLDKAKTSSEVTVEGYEETIEITNNVPMPFDVSPTAKKVLDKCFTVPAKIEFREAISAKDDDAVIRVNGGRFKTWKKTFVGLNKDTQHNAQGAIISKDDIPGFKSLIQSTLAEYMFKILGGEKGNSVTVILKHFPVMKDMTESYSNEEWFKAFDIDNDMQADIAKYLKDYK